MEGREDTRRRRRREREKEIERKEDSLVKKVKEDYKNLGIKRESNLWIREN